MTSERERKQLRERSPLIKARRLTPEALEIIERNNDRNHDGTLNGTVIIELLQHIKALEQNGLEDETLAAMSTPVAANLTHRLTAELMRRLTASQVQRGIIRG